MGSSFIVESWLVVDGGFTYLIILFPCWFFEEVGWLTKDRAAWSFYQLESIIILLRLPILSVLVLSNLFIHQVSQFLLHAEVLLLFREGILQVIEVLLLLEAVRFRFIAELTRDLLFWEMPKSLASIIELWILLALHEVHIRKLAIDIWFGFSRFLENSALDILAFILLRLAIHAFLPSISLDNTLQVIVAAQNTGRNWRVRYLLYDISQYKKMTIPSGEIEDCSSIWQHSFLLRHQIIPFDFDVSDLPAVERAFPC